MVENTIIRSFNPVGKAYSWFTGGEMVRVGDIVPSARRAAGNWRSCEDKSKQIDEGSEIQTIERIAMRMT
jgi:hypothetical protein